MNTSKIRAPIQLSTPVYIFAGVLLLRLIVLARLTASPFLLPTRGDMHFYSKWARHILAGHFADGLAFYGLPGYAWLLAFFYKCIGFNPFVPAFIQAALDAGTAVLIYKIGVRVFGGRLRFAHAIGLLAALGWAFFVPAQTYAAILMPTAWVVFVFWFVVWEIVRRSDAPGKTAAFLFGLVIGMTATAVATILFLLPLVAGAIWRSARPARLASLGLLAAGIIAGTSPCWMHNYFIAHDPVVLSAHSGINFWIGNNPTANGYPRFPPGLRAGQAAMLQDSIDAAENAAGHSLRRGEVSRYWSAQARDYIVHHPVAWLKLLALKCRNFCNAFQYDDLSVITGLREEGVTFPGLYFGLVATFALPGLLLAWKIEPLSRWITAALVLHALALLPVFTTERYRLPVVPGLLLFAAFGLVLFWQNLSALRLRPVLSYAALLLVSVMFVSSPQRDPSLWALDAYNSGRQALESGNLRLAETKLQQAHSYVPTNAETNFALGNLRFAQGDRAAARAFYLTTLELDPGNDRALTNLGIIAEDENQPAAAATFFRLACTQQSGNAKTHYLLAKALLAIGDKRNSALEIQRAITLRGNEPEFLALRSQIEQAQ